MKTLKNNFGSTCKNKEEYISPNCKVYDLEIEGMICGSKDDDTTGTGTNPGNGGETGFPQSRNSEWN